MRIKVTGFVDDGAIREALVNGLERALPGRAVLIQRTTERLTAEFEVDGTVSEHPTRATFVAALQAGAHHFEIHDLTHGRDLVHLTA